MLKTYVNTIKYLKPEQIFYRIHYALRKKWRTIRNHELLLIKQANCFPLFLEDSIEIGSSLYHNYEFRILNITKKFDYEIDWDFDKYGKLWTYNLNYFEYLNGKEDISLIYDYINSIEYIKDGLEPYPISLRAINWIKFLNKYQIHEPKIINSLYAQYYILLDNLEYHLLGNHLLENGFSLLFGAYYFQDESLYEKAKEILSKELNEQILEDGGHFELSPMYHQIMLFRVLDCINLVKNNKWKNRELLPLLNEKAAKMLGWLESITYEDGTIPLFNDSANNIAPSSRKLFAYAKKLGIKGEKVILKDSGYRKIKKDIYECIIDIGRIGAEYIPGHAHADTFNFELHIEKRPFIVDTGISTYEWNNIREFERSTKAHNTVEVNNSDSSEVWGSFRVADRANVREIMETENHIKATHDGYKKRFGILHTREWMFNEREIIIKDRLNKRSKAVARLHFHPDVSKKEIEERISVKANYKISSYNYAPEFNKRLDALMIEIPFEKNLEVVIKI